MNKNHLISGTIMLILGGALALAILYYLPHCHADKMMRCMWMKNSIALVGFMVAFLGLALAFARNSAFAMGIQLAQVVNGLAVVALSTFAIGPCMSPMMKCHSVTQPIVIVWGLVIAVVALLHMICLKKRCSNGACAR